MKRVVHYVLFRIDDLGVTAFRQRLNLLIPIITTTAQAQHDRKKVAACKKVVAELGIALPPLPMWASISLSLRPVSRR